MNKFLLFLLFLISISTKGQEYKYCYTSLKYSYTQMMSIDQYGKYIEVGSMEISPSVHISCRYSITPERFSLSFGDPYSVLYVGPIYPVKEEIFYWRSIPCPGSVINCYENDKEVECICHHLVKWIKPFNMLPVVIKWYPKKEERA